MPDRDFQRPGRSPVMATSAMAATSVPIAVWAALDTMRSGGNALDAAVAAAGVLAVVEPQSTGIGGDCFCLWAPAGAGRVIALNGSGRAPAAASIEWFEARGIDALDPISPHAVTVPGAVSAWETLLAAHGTRGLDTVLQPAIRLAEEGWPVAARVAHDWAANADKLRDTGATHWLPGGDAPRPGDRFANPALARTLRTIARNGARAFYEGEVAASLVAALRARGGQHTEADFADGLRAAVFVEPIRKAFRGYDVWECPPNNSGITALQMLGILGGMPPAEGGPLGASRLHRHVEVARLCYRDRDAFVADPSQAAVPVAQMLDDAYLARLGALLDPARALPHLPPPGEASPHRDTVYLCTVDRDGNACSFINSLFQSFGSGILDERTGVMLHNRGCGFRLQRGHPDCIAPRKRPLHTIMPGMLTKDGQAVMPFGVMGGQFQPMGNTLVLANLLDYGLDVQQAIDLARVFPSGGALEVERGVPRDVVDQLSRLGHRPVTAAEPLGGAQAIWMDRARGCLIAGSDPRKDGLALGY